MVIEKKASISEVKSGMCFSRVSVQKLWSRDDQRCTSCWQLNLVLCESQLGGVHFEGRKGGLQGQLRLCTIKKVLERPLVKVRLSCRKHPSTLEQPLRTTAVVEGSQPEFRRQGVCVAEDKTGEMIQDPWMISQDGDIVTVSWSSLLK